MEPERNQITTAAVLSNFLYYHSVTSISFRNLELFMLFHVRLHRIEAFSES